MAMLTFSAARVGPTSLDIIVTDAEGLPVTPQAVTVRVSQAASGIELFKVEAVDVGEDTWRVDDRVLPVPGNWDVELDVRLSRFALTKLAGTLEIVGD